MTPPAIHPSRSGWRGLALLAAALAILGASCAGAGETPPAAAFTPGPSQVGTTGVSASPVIPDSPIAGIVTSVDATGLTEVKGFTLRTSGGEDLTFVIGSLDNGDEFRPGHLTEHMATAGPILVSFKVVDGRLIVFHMDDAP